MKRSLVLVPFILLVVLNACGGPNSLPTALSDSQWTQVALMATNRMLTPTFTPTSIPNKPMMVQLINDELEKSDQLELMIDARYFVTDVKFTDYYGIPSSDASIIRLEADCQCPKNYQCCYPERIFLKVVEAIKLKRDDITKQVPSTVTEFDVACFDHGAQVATVTANWSAIKSYLYDQIIGYQLAPSVWRK
jgi:hypothetical protein